MTRTSAQADDAVDQVDIGRIELGDTRWPVAQRRLGFRAVLGVSAEEDLGFHPRRDRRV